MTGSSKRLKFITRAIFLCALSLASSTIHANVIAVQNPPTTSVQGLEPAEEQNYNFDEIDAEAPIDKAKFKVGQTIFVKANAVNFRATPEPKGKYLETLNQGDALKITDLLLQTNTDFVQVKVISGSAGAKAAGLGYISLRLVTLNPSAEDAPIENTKYFVIQNVATERTRVYERCTEGPDCANKLILETEMVAGRPEEGNEKDRYAFVTMLGKGLIARWIKFHGNEIYPPWYSASDELGNGKLNLPPPHNLSSWFVKYNGQTTNKGAFGWYKAELYPADGVAQQWIHGTIGWGADQDDAIEATRGFWINVFANPGSHGCTRLENQAVAFMRSFLPVGTPVFRIYAREAHAKKPELVQKKWWKPAEPANLPAGSWEWILTKVGAGNINGLTADAAEVSRQKLSDSAILERGVFHYSRTPKAVPLNYLERASSGKSGDRYELTEGDDENVGRFKGLYLVDEGRLFQYQHPLTEDKRIRLGGMPDFFNRVPDYINREKETDFWVPKVVLPNKNKGPRGL